MKRMITAMTLSAALLLLAVPAAFAGSPTCSDLEFLDVANHGEHILRDYVGPNGSAAGGAPAHHGGAPAPGASFCLGQAQSPGLHF